MEKKLKAILSLLKDDFIFLLFICMCLVKMIIFVLFFEILLKFQIKI